MSADLVDEILRSTGIPRRSLLRNIEAKRSLLEAGSLFEWGGEQALMIVRLDSPKFYAFVEELESTLRKILTSIRN